MNDEILRALAPEDSTESGPAGPGRPKRVIGLVAAAIHALRAGAPTMRSRPAERS